MFNFLGVLRLLPVFRNHYSSKDLESGAGQFSIAVGVCLDGSSRLTFIQADFERIASEQANNSADAALQMGNLRKAMAHVLSASQETRIAANLAKDAVLQVELDAERTEHHIRSVSKSILDAQVLLNELSSKSTKIEQIVQSIEKIARETTLLAINAKIEAARAGESGRGFAVVADSVKHLAVQTNEATFTIQKLLGSTVSDVRHAGALIDLAMQEVTVSARLANQVATRSVDAKSQAAMVDSEVKVIVEQLDTVAVSASSLDQRVRGLAAGAQQITMTASQARESARSVLESAIILKRQDQIALNHERTPLKLRLLNLTEIARGETVLALNAEPAEVEKTLERIRALEDELNNLLANGKSDDVAIRFHAIWREYSTLRQDALELAMRGFNAEAIEFTAKKNRPKYQELRQFLSSS